MLIYLKVRTRQNAAVR